MCRSALSLVTFLFATVDAHSSTEELQHRCIELGSEECLPPSRDDEVASASANAADRRIERDRTVPMLRDAPAWPPLLGEAQLNYLTTRAGTPEHRIPAMVALSNDVDDVVLRCFGWLRYALPPPNGRIIRLLSSCELGDAPKCPDPPAHAWH
jgi:hypothetical protein